MPFLCDGRFSLFSSAACSRNLPGLAASPWTELLCALHLYSRRQSCSGWQQGQWSQRGLRPHLQRSEPGSPLHSVEQAEPSRHAKRHARYKASTASSVYLLNAGAYGSSLAVNGSLTPFVHTGDADFSPWLAVDLGAALWLSGLGSTTAGNAARAWLCSC
jgi:hypothetical protein